MISLEGGYLDFLEIYSFYDPISPFPPLDRFEPHVFELTARAPRRRFRLPRLDLSRLRG